MEALRAKPFRRSPGVSSFLLPFSAVLLLLTCWVAGSTAHKETTSIIQHASLGELAIQDAALKAVEAISKVQQWRLDEQATLVGSLEDVSIASTTRYDFKISGLGDAPEGIEFSVGEEPESWEEVGNLALPVGRVEKNGDAALVLKQQLSRRDVATLPETDISGPVELWFRESPNMRLALPVSS